MNMEYSKSVQCIICLINYNHKKKDQKHFRWNRTVECKKKTQILHYILNLYFCQIKQPTLCTFLMKYCYIFYWGFLKDKLLQMKIKSRMYMGTCVFIKRKQDTIKNQLFRERLKVFPPVKIYFDIKI